MINLKEARTLLRMTQAQFAKFLDIPVTTYQDLENAPGEPAPWVESLIFEKVNRYLESRKVLPLVIDDTAREIHNELDEDLLEGDLQPTDIIQAVIIDDHLVDWYYDEKETEEYMKEADSKERFQYVGDRPHLLSISVRELLFYIEQAPEK